MAAEELLKQFSINSSSVFQLNIWSEISPLRQAIAVIGNSTTALKTFNTLARH
jgi:hypothetical protein